MLSVRVGSIPSTNGVAMLVIIPRDDAMHSFILNRAGQVGGYDQPDWLTSAGTPSQFTPHTRNEIKWRTGKRSKITLTNGSKGRVY
jgi:hypothetical protein